MKKIIIYMLGIIMLCFLIPILFTNAKIIKIAVNEDNIEEIEAVTKQYDYSKYNTVKLLHVETGEIEEINLDEYILGVVAAEMPVDYEIEALKAQAVVARTYTMYKIVNNNHKHDIADICDDFTCCQAWIDKEDRFLKWDSNEAENNWKKIVKAVYDTVGQIIVYDNKPINAFFHSNSGGMTEVPINVWGGGEYPYLQVVQTSGEENYSQYKSEVELTKEEIIEKLKEKYSEIQINWEEENQVQILEYTDSGRVKTIKFGNLNLSGVEARTIFGLKSANFTIEIKENSIKFEVKGYGHGVGLSQTGSDSLAKQGLNYQEIIKHFYKNVEVINY